MVERVMIIGNTSVDFHLGSILIRSAENLSMDLFELDTNTKTAAPSMNNVWGKVFFKLSGKRPIEWWLWNQKIVETIIKINPDLVIVTGIVALTKEVFDTCHQTGAKIVNYLTDSPWSKQNTHHTFTKNISKYDCIFSTKTAIITDLERVGVKKVVFLPFAFDPSFHQYLPSSLDDFSKPPDVCLIGGADGERIDFINRFLTNYQGSLGLYGGYWGRNQQLKQYDRGSVFDDVFCRTVHDCKINIGLVRRANKDGHSMRSYEIPACGGLGIYEDTPEHRDIFLGYPEYGFFSEPEDLAEKCNWLLDRPIEQEEMRKLGIKLVVNDSNTYTARLKTILEWADL